MPRSSTLGVLKKRSEFLAVSAYRKRWVSRAFVLQIAPRDPLLSPSIAFGLTASKKMVGDRAVDRNRARRRLRALAFALFPEKGKEHANYVLLAKRESLTLPYALLRKDLEQALSRLNFQVKSD